MVSQLGMEPHPVVPRGVSTGTLELKVQEKFQTAEGRKEKIIE